MPEQNLRPCASSWCAISAGEGSALSEGNGDILENPVTGERMHFLQTSADTKGEYVLPFPPVWMQRGGLALGAPVGRALGFRATYEPAWAAASSTA